MMATAKQEVQKILERLPDDATLEDIQYHIYVLEKIRQGLKDAEEGKLIEQDEMEQRMEKWLGE
jgi:predicted transcriptional regulator